MSLETKNSRMFESSLMGQKFTSKVFETTRIKETSTGKIQVFKKDSIVSSRKIQVFKKEKHEQKQLFYYLLMRILLKFAKHPITKMA